MRKIEDCEVGEVVTIKDVHDRCLALKLASVGLRVGDSIKIVSKMSDGPIVVEHTLHGNKIAIGKNMLKKIYVI
ncbi:MAG: ferrous iron transport protein A [Archaeoglobaceae archaeon]|nr:ferrous iron transport protein A [Archaeoglobaceae archaeon]MDW8014016.1 FeoA family protein [Archaeoglobaceae archaeon]